MGEHHFPSMEFKMVRKKAHHNEELCLDLLRFFSIQNVDCNARKIEVKDEELKIVLNLCPGLFILYTVRLRNVTPIPRI